MGGSDDKSNASERSQSPIKINKRGKVSIMKYRYSYYELPYLN